MTYRDLAMPSRAAQQAANAATNLYAFNCLGAESVVLRNKRVELASKKSEFAEIGMKAALAAATYPKFDRYCDGTIEAEDIARAFAHVEGVSWEVCRRMRSPPVHLLPCIVSRAPPVCIARVHRPCVSPVVTSPVHLSRASSQVAYMIAKNILSDADTEPSEPGEGASRHSRSLHTPLCRAETFPPSTPPGSPCLPFALLLLLAHPTVPAVRAARSCAQARGSITSSS